MVRQFVKQMVENVKNAK